MQVFMFWIYNFFVIYFVGRCVDLKTSDSVKAMLTEQAGFHVPDVEPYKQRATSLHGCFTYYSANAYCSLYAILTHH